MRKFILIAVISAFIAACGSSAGTPSAPPAPPGIVINPGPHGSPTPTPKATPTPKPTPTPTPVPTPTPQPTLPPSGSVLVAVAATPPGMSIVNYSAPGNGHALATTADGAIYVSQASNQNTLLKFLGSIQTLTLPNGYFNVGYLTRGSDGAIWFSNSRGGLQAQAIGRVDASGTFTEYDIPWPMSAAPFGMNLGPDGNVWFAEFYEGRVGRITPAGTLTDFALGPGGHRPSDVAAGPDGNMWVVESADPTIERLSTSGTLLNTYNVGQNLFRIVAGPDGAMWFVDSNNVIGRIDMTGKLWLWSLPCYIPNYVNFCTPGYFQADTDITVGPDGNLWFAAENFQAIGRLTPMGVLNEWPVPQGSSPFSITSFGPNVIWVGGGNALGYITP